MILQQTRVLIIEEDEKIRKMAYSALSREGLLVAEAENGVSPLDMIGEKSFDILIMDVMLPPPLNIAEMIKSSQALLPESRAIFIYRGVAPITEHLDINNLISVPFDSRQLVGCVYEMMLRAFPTEAVRPSVSNEELSGLEERVDLLMCQLEAAMANGDVCRSEAIRTEVIRAVRMRAALAQELWARGPW